MHKVAELKMAYDVYEIIGRVYVVEPDGNWFRVLVLVKCAGKAHAVNYKRVYGLYWARKALMEMVMDAHGQY